MPQLIQSIKDVRSKATATLKEMAQDLTSLAEQLSGADSRKAIVDSCAPVLAFSEVRSPWSYYGWMDANQRSDRERFCFGYS
jgi:hypothetical protein